MLDTYVRIWRRTHRLHAVVDDCVSLCTGFHACTWLQGPRIEKQNGRYPEK